MATEQGRAEPHRHARDQFPEYATAQVLGRSPAHEYPDVAAHLAGCADCRRELAALLLLLAPTYSDRQDAVAPVAARPDLAFLRPQAAARTPWRLDDIGRLVASLGDLLGAAPATPRPLGATRGTLLHSLNTSGPAEADGQFVVEIWQDDPEQGLCRLRIGVDRPAADPLDQGGVAIALHDGDLIRHATTDALGQVEFHAVSLARLPDLRLTIGR